MDAVFLTARIPLPCKKLAPTLPTMQRDVQSEVAARLLVAASVTSSELKQRWGAAEEVKSSSGGEEHLRSSWRGEEQLRSSWGGEEQLRWWGAPEKVKSSWRGEERLKRWRAVPNTFSWCSPEHLSQRVMCACVYSSHSSPSFSTNKTTKEKQPSFLLFV